MSLQVYIDDSGTKGTGRVLTLGGLIGPATAIAEVSEKWDMECRAKYPGRIAYFKADEARDLDGEFLYWAPENRDLKIRFLSKVLDRSDLMAIFVAVDLYAHTQMERVSELRKISDAKRHGQNHPLFLAFHVLLLTVGSELLSRKATEKFEIFFDNQEKFKDELRAQYPVLLQAIEKRSKQARALFPEDVHFRDDKDYVVLQAADLIAGDMRMSAERDKKWTPLASRGFKHLKLSRFSMVLHERRLRKMAESWTGVKFSLVPRGSSSVSSASSVSRQQRRAAKRQASKRSKRDGGQR